MTTISARDASRGFAALTVEVLPYTRSTAAQHALLLDYVRPSGKARGAHDLVIAAHALQTGRRIVSADLKARFADLPGVKVAD